MGILKKQSLVDQIYDEIKNLIINLEVPLGSKLNVSELQDKFGVSSTPIREAINRLQKDGIVEYENNIGAKVIAITSKDVEEIQEVSFALQTGAIRYSMQKSDTFKIAEEIKDYIDKCMKAEKKEEFFSYINKIANIFYIYANNSRLVGSANLMYAQQAILGNILAKEINYNDDFKKAYIENFINLYEAVKNKDEIEAIKSFERNNFQTRDIIISGLEKLEK